MKMYIEITNIFSGYSFYKKCIKILKRQPLKSIYTTFIPKFFRKRIEFFADISQQNYVAEKWRILLEYQQKNNISFHIKPKKEFGNSKIIWQYWGQGWEYESLPDIVKLCYRSIEENKGDYQVIRLDDHSVQDYLDIPEFILKKRKNPEFKYAFYSDLIRLMLLNAYGGVWLDATILLTNKIPEWCENQELFIFHRELNNNQSMWEKLNEKYFSWHPKHRVRMLNSIMFSEKKNRLIEKLLNSMLLFWKTQDKIPHYFFFQILFDEMLNRNFTNDSFTSLDDTLPHLLQCILKEPFELKAYHEIIEKTPFHKMTYLKNDKKGTYYEYLSYIFNPK